MDIITEHWLSEVQKIAVEAGEEIMRIYNDSAGIEIDRKDDNSPLTKADKAANEIIIKGLSKLDPEYPIISEENKAIDYEERKDFTFYWVVDPLDGTKEFIKRNGEFTVNIALCKNERSIFGVVYLPETKELYYASKGQGAFKKSDESLVALNVPSFSKKDKALKLVASRSHINDKTQAFLEDFDSPEILSVGSSLKFLRIAEGKAHIYPRLAPTMEWDTAAAQIVLEEAGGKVLQHENGLPVIYNKENLLNPFFVAYGKMEELEEA